jgi:hypothetical protein
MKIIIKDVFQKFDHVNRNNGRIYPQSVFDDTNKLLIKIQRLLIRESRKEKIKKLFNND